MAITPQLLDAAWKKALTFWGLAIQVELPRLDPKSKALAYIDLQTRDVVVNPVQLEQFKADECLEALLTHELGHHLRYPHSLATQARLELLEKEILPVRGYSLLNLFSDLLINTEIARERRLQDQLVKIYVGMPEGELASDPCFFFYLTCYEEAWNLPPRLLTRKAGVQLEEKFPGVRAEAQLLIQELPNLAPNLFTQFIYFASVVSRYQLLDPEKGEAGRGTHQQNPTHDDHSSPSPDDYADALRRSAQESEAIRRAIKEGWLNPAELPSLDPNNAVRTGGLPGVLAGQPKKLADAMAIHYRRLAEKHLFRPPPEKKSGDPIIPSTLSPWERGDAPGEIDWISSLLLGGPQLGVASPVKRDWIDDEPPEGVSDVRIRVEIYLDVSGSMPDPKTAVNPMTLGAQVLCMSAIRHGGQARGLIYSTNNVSHWEWTRSEQLMSRFLMNYIGGGTDYPFAVLERSVRDCGLHQPVRVVLTDSDYSYNLKSLPKNRETVSGAAHVSPYVVMLNGVTNVQEPWVQEIAATGARVVPVPDMKDFPRVAAALGDALFGKSAATLRRPRAKAAAKKK